MGVSLKGILNSVAPVIASALPGPLGGIARSVLKDVLGNPDASDAEIEKALATANPEVLLKLRQADADFSAKMKQLDIDLEKLAAEDRASARAMQIATRSWTPMILAAVVVIGWLAAFGFLVFRPLPSANADAIMLALGTLNAALTLVLGYYFGSSAGSRNKDETIRKLGS